MIYGGNTRDGWLHGPMACLFFRATSESCRVVASFICETETYGANSLGTWNLVDQQTNMCSRLEYMCIVSIALFLGLYCGQETENLKYGVAYGL